MPLIFSTLTGSVTYTDWKLSAGGLSIAGREVTIKGGANVASKHLLTPRGIGTKVTDEELAFLETDVTFLMHKKNGFITIDSVGDIRDADLAASDMEGRDDSAPDTPNDFLADGVEPPTTTTVVIDTPPPVAPARRRK